MRSPENSLFRSADTNWNITRIFRKTPHLYRHYKLTFECHNPLEKYHKYILYVPIFFHQCKVYFKPEKLGLHHFTSEHKCCEIIF